MRLNYILYLSACFILCIAIPTNALTESEIDTVIQKMSIEEKVGQLLMVGFGGKKVSAVVKAHITKRFAGGIILYGRNIETPEQVAKLTRGLQQIAQQTPSRIPLFIATDQEGGIVTRLKKGATVLPGNMALGATRNEMLAEQAGELTGVELAAVGINLNFAPVMDVNNNPRNPVISVRSYGESPHLVSQLGTAYIRGLQRQNVLAVAKHFPGHGDTHVDSHKKLPTVRHDTERFSAVELVPFRAAIDARVNAIMSAHILYPALDEDVPATLSHRILTGVLREQLGFEGLIITDDLEMKAIDTHYQTERAAVMAIQAGADIILVPWTLKKQQQAYNALRKAVQRGDIPIARLDKSVRRILAAKSALRQTVRNLEDVGSSKHRDIAQTIAARAITLVKNHGRALPLKTETSQVPTLLISPSRLFANTFRKAHTDISHITSVPIPKQFNAESLLRLLIQESQGTSVIVAGIASGQQAELIHQLSQRTSIPIVVISFASPYLLAKCPDVAAAIAAYDENYVSMLAAVEVLLGKKQATGTLPVTIPTTDAAGASKKTLPK